MSGTYNPSDLIAMFAAACVGVLAATLVVAVATHRMRRR